MAIKIDLLPGYVKLEKLLKTAIFASVAGIALVSTALVLVYNQKTLDLTTAQQNTQEVERVAKLTDAAVADKTAFDTAAAPKTTTVELILNISKTGAQRAALLGLVTQYIYKDALVKSIDISDGAKVNIVATVKDPEQYLNFLNTLRRGGDVAPNNGPLYTGNPAAGGVKSVTKGGATYVPQIPGVNDPPLIVEYPITVTAAGDLKYKVDIPKDPTLAAAGAAGAGGTPGAPGMTSPTGGTPAG